MLRKIEEYIRAIVIKDFGSGGDEPGVSLIRAPKLVETGLDTALNVEKDVPARTDDTCRIDTEPRLGGNQGPVR